ncbi:MAG: VWA domain-containing protein [Acidobacteriota bacterium]|nr:VWA domain-containing protein [Acidobacteriota bacterium]MDH3786537.1 VWA domain-containing protein [Acidobacteriota bacterium]
MRVKAAGIVLIVGLAVTLAGTILLADETEGGSTPIDIQRTEEVQVKWILIDVVALDRKGDPVTDLTIDEFDVMVGFDRVTPRSLDVDCEMADYDPTAPSVEVNAVAAAALARTKEKRVVLFFDYRHMSNPPEMVRQTVNILENAGLNGLPHMVVSLADGIRIHQDFTHDVDAVIEAVKTMSQDPAVYAVSNNSLTERRTFDSLLDFYNLMEFVPGRKIVLFMSGIFSPNGWNYDVEYRLLAAMASRTRTALYPVDSAGLTAGLRPGGDPFLARLANETGGRFTRNTNDLSRGIVRAHRDISCRYTLGVHDPRPTEDKRKRLRVFIRRDGVRPHYPSGHVQRSQREMQRSMARTARVSTHGYDDGGVTMDIISMRPISPARWDVRLVLRAPSDLIQRADDESPWQFGGVIRRANGTVVQSFRQPLNLKTPEVVGVEGAGLYYRSFRLPPGGYTANAYAYHPSMKVPLGFSQPFEIRDVPVDRPFAMEPMLVLAKAAEDPKRDRAPYVPVPGTTLPDTRGLGVYFQVCDFTGQKVEWSAVTEALQRSSAPSTEVALGTHELQFTRRGDRCAGRLDPIDYGQLGEIDMTFWVQSQATGRDLSVETQRVWRVENTN